MTFSFLHILL